MPQSLAHSRRQIIPECVIMGWSFRFLTCKTRFIVPITLVCSCIQQIYVEPLLCIRLDSSPGFAAENKASKTLPELTFQQREAE